MLLLAADDEPTHLLLLKGYLRGLDVKFLPCDDGWQALEAWRLHRPSLLLLDLKMPGYSGFELARIVRRDAGERRPLVVAMSASSSREAGVDQAPDLWDGFLEKPVPRAALMKILLKHFGIVDEAPASP